MKYDLVLIAGVVLIVSSVLLLIVLYFVDKEHKKQLKEAVDKTRNDWIMAFDSNEKLRDKEADALKYALSVKDDLIAEKDKRIEDLESRIALNEMIMACAKVDGSIDVKALVKLAELERKDDE